jgi:hypothetical protein
MDDLNYLLFREQTERMNADTASCAESRIAHGKLAVLFAARVTDHPSPYRSAQDDGSVPFENPLLAAA